MALVGGAVGGTYWLLEHPEHIGPLVCTLAGWPEGSVVLGDLEVGERVRLIDFELHPPGLRAPDVFIASGEVDWPDPYKLWEKEVHLGKVDARGVRVTGSEIVGLIPLNAMLDAGRYFLDKQRRSLGVSTASTMSG